MKKALDIWANRLRVDQRKNEAAIQALLFQKEFLSADVCRITGIKSNTFGQWLARGFIRPSRPAGRSGYRNVFTMEDLCRIELFRLLTDSGFSRTNAAKFAFPAAEDGVSDKIERIFKKAIKAIKDYVTGGEGTLLTGSSRFPEPLFLAFWHSTEGTWVMDVNTVDQFTKLYKHLQFQSGAYVVNVTEIANAVFEKIKSL